MSSRSDFGSHRTIENEIQIIVYVYHKILGFQFSFPPAEGHYVPGIEATSKKCPKYNKYQTTNIIIGSRGRAIFISFYLTTDDGLAESSSSPPYSSSPCVVVVVVVVFFFLFSPSFPSLPMAWQLKT